MQIIPDIYYIKNVDKKHEAQSVVGKYIEFACLSSLVFICYQIL